MDPYEKLLCDIDVPVIEDSILENTGYTALYRDGRIYLEKELSLRDKRTYLAEEYAHHKTSVGDIVDYNDPAAWKQEWKARRYSIEMLISLDSLVECALSDCRTKKECADFLDVSEELLEDSFIHYINKYGITHSYNGYRFYFNENCIRIEKED